MPAKPATSPLVAEHYQTTKTDPSSCKVSIAPKAGQVPRNCQLPPCGLSMQHVAASNKPALPSLVVGQHNSTHHGWHWKMQANVFLPCPTKEITASHNERIENDPHFVENRLPSLSAQLAKTLLQRKHSLNMSVANYFCQTEHSTKSSAVLVVLPACGPSGRKSGTQCPKDRPFGLVSLATTQCKSAFPMICA